MDELNDNALPDDVKTLKALVKSLSKKVAKQQQWIEALEEERRLARAKLYGASSEHDPAQKSLFNEAEELVEQEEPEPEETPAPSSTKPRPSRGGRRPFPKELPRERVIHDIADDQKQCSCGCALDCIGEVIREQLEIIPAQLKVIEHVRKKYVCKQCDQALITAPMPAQPLPKSMVSPGALAYLATSKYADGLPLYRLSQILHRLGIDYGRHTMAHQLNNVGLSLAQPLINLFQDHLLSHPVLQMDETRVQVLKEPERSAKSDSWMWVMRGGPPDKTAVLFHYEASRGKSIPLQLLNGYQGYLQTDGYAAYKQAINDYQLTGIGCMAHARRKFKDAQKALPKKANDKTRRVEQALSFFTKLYQIERGVKEASIEQRYEARQRLSIPVLERFKAWLDRQQINPESKLGQAIGYRLKQWERLVVYCTDGRLSIDNNAVENVIRPFAVGRKNWLFSSTPKGAQASANLYSLITTAKIHGLNEYAYLKHIFTQLPLAQSVEDYEKLLPWNIDRFELIQYIQSAAA